MTVGFKKNLDKMRRKKMRDAKFCDELHSAKKRRANNCGCYFDSGDDGLKGVDGKPRRGKVLVELIKLRDDQEQKPVKPTPMRRSVSCSSRQNPRVVFSQLIQNNVVLLGAHVCYRGGNGTAAALAEGWISSKGIKCMCCDKVFGISEFEVHAGSKKRRPGLNIVLDDGRSLLDCQREILCDNKNGAVTGSSLDLIEGNSHEVEKFYACCVCQYGGELVLCNLCKANFHKNCLGLKDVPIGDWFCPACCCKICGEGKFETADEYCEDDDDVFRACDQCEHGFHKGCIRSRGGGGKNYAQNKWFCSDRCEHIFSSLCELSRRPISLGVDDLTWRILKPEESYHEDVIANGLTESKVSEEKKRKLNDAVDVMHECFEPATDPLTGRDIVEDVIFNRRSQVKQKNFQGFYTVILEKKGEIASVATVRVYEEVAEIPLVATMFKYRRHGMCRRLMDNLEKHLFSLGITQLLLPAAPNVLDTWITKFGFSKMSDSERLKYLKYNLLDFQDTIMCQKRLMKTPSTNLCPSGATWSKIADADIKFGSSSPVSVLEG